MFALPTPILLPLAVTVLGIMGLVALLELVILTAASQPFGVVSLIAAGFLLQSSLKVLCGIPEKVNAKIA